MGRPRFQRGYVTKQGRNWRGEYYETVLTDEGQSRRIHRSVVLGQRSKVRKTEAERKLQEILTRYQRVLPDGSVTLRWFIETQFLPTKEARWKESTKGTSLGIIKKQITEPIGETPIREFDRGSLQKHINKLADKGYSHSVVQHTVSFLKNIFDLAEELEFVQKNPARRLDIPRVQQEYIAAPQNALYTRKPYLRPEELKTLLGLMEGRNRLIAMLAGLMAMRPGEIFGLTWESYHEGNLFIMQRVYRRRFDTPKTPASMAYLPVPKIVREALDKWQAECLPKVGKHGFIFPSRTGQSPLDQYNYSNRTLKPCGSIAVGLFPVTFQVLRRTWATHAPRHGAGLKDIECVLRHSGSLNFSVGTYQQGIRENILNVMDKFASEVAGDLPEEAQSIPVELAEEAKKYEFLPRSTTRKNVIQVSYSKQNAEVAELADAPA